MMQMGYAIWVNDRLNVRHKGTSMLIYSKVRGMAQEIVCMYGECSIMRLNFKACKWGGS